MTSDETAAVAAARNAPFAWLLSALGLTSCVLNGAGMTGWGSIATVRMLALVLIADGVGYALRWLTHLGYYLGSDSSATVRRLVGTEFVVLILWLLGGALALLTGNPLILFGSAVLLVVAVALLAAELTGALEDTTDLDGASTRVEMSRLGQRVQLNLLRLRADRLLNLLGHNGPRGTVSASALAVWGVLAFVSVSSALPASVKLAGALEALAPDPADPTITTTKPRTTTAASERSPARSPVVGRSGASPPVSTPEPPVTYERLCGPEPSGAPAPEPQATALRDVFLREGGVHAGCAETPAPVGKGDDGTWVMGGRCDGELWSLAVAGREGESGILLGRQAANVGQLLAQSGKLVATSNRTRIRSGSAYVLNTTEGALVLIRRQSADGADAPDPQSCEAVAPNGVRYVVLSPTLAQLWLALSQERFVWPQRIGTDGRDVLFAFVPDTPGAAPVAFARCAGSDCRMANRDGSAFVERAVVTIEAIMQVAG